MRVWSAAVNLPPLRWQDPQRAMTDDPATESRLLSFLKQMVFIFFGRNHSSEGNCCCSIHS